MTAMATHRPRLVGDVLIGTRQAAALLVHRHRDQVRRHCRPIACDVATKAALYDLDAVAEAFRDTRRRSVA